MKTLTVLAVLLVSRVAGADDKRVATAATDAPRSIVVHVAPTTAAIGEPITLEARIDAPFAEQLSVRWRRIGDKLWQDVPFERSSAGGWFAMLPPEQPPGVEYYIRGTDASGLEVQHFASETSPHLVRVDPSLYDRLEELDLRRLHGHRDQVSFDVTGHDFGNRYAIPDEFIRSELAYTHQMLRFLYRVTFGFGTIDGRTPVMSDEGGSSAYHALRYGFGQVTLRPHESVFLDAMLALGASDQGFVQGARGGITFGKPWRSSVSVGGEYFGDLGGTAWVRLQWDTAPPFLMGASIVRTDLPGSVIDRIGLYLSYDASYPITDQFSLRGAVSYGSRDGSAHFGGSLGGAVAF